jgi:hypothetical protein
MTDNQTQPQTLRDILYQNGSVIGLKLNAKVIDSVNSIDKIKESVDKAEAFTHVHDFPCTLPDGTYDEISHINEVLKPGSLYTFNKGTAVMIFREPLPVPPPP